MKPERQTAALPKGGRLRHRIAERHGRRVDESVFDHEVAGENASSTVSVRISRKNRWATMASQVVCACDSHALGKRLRGWPSAIRNVYNLARAATKRLARACRVDTDSTSDPSSLRALATITPSTTPKMSRTLSRRDAAADQHGERGGGSDGADVVEIGGVPGALAGRDDDVGVEELDVTHEFGERPVLHDGVRAMLDVCVGEDAYAVRSEFRGGSGSRARRRPRSDPRWRHTRLPTG